MDRNPINELPDEDPPDSSGLPADERPPAADSTELGDAPSPSSTPFSPTDPAAGRPAGSSSAPIPPSPL
ncbi:MAG: hypothetical protein EBY61_08330, partial [Actinobacteria bacterium]|nr:hypothetical protein [Actinomycetota bacterium]